MQIANSKMQTANWKMKTVNQIPNLKLQNISFYDLERIAKYWIIYHIGKITKKRSIFLYNFPIL